jgi:hypothetical protein
VCCRRKPQLEWLSSNRAQTHTVGG